MPYEKSDVVEYVEIDLLEDMELETGFVIPWFGKLGMATQVMFGEAIESLAKPNYGKPKVKIIPKQTPSN